jgi:hypothetical protein
MNRSLLTMLVLVVIAACGGGPATATRTPNPPSPSPRPTAAAPTSDGSAALCFLTAADWQQFNYVTGAEPDIIPDQPEGTTICQYASGLFLEVYTQDTESEAEETLQTIVENIPMDEPEELTLPGADEAMFDADTGDNHAAIAFRAGRAAFVITGLARDTVQSELMTLAGLVLTRSTAIQ